MDIQETALRVLGFIYTKQKTGEREIREASELPERTVRKSLQLLFDTGLIKSQFKNISGEQQGLTCTSDGIALVTSKPRSHERRGILVNANMTNIDTLVSFDFSADDGFGY